jgi:hypothetical protein
MVSNCHAHPAPSVCSTTRCGQQHHVGAFYWLVEWGVSPASLRACRAPSTGWARGVDLMRAPNPLHVEWYEREKRHEAIQEIADSQAPRVTHQAVSQAVARVKRWIATGGAITSPPATGDAIVSGQPGVGKDIGAYATSPDGLDVEPGKSPTPQERNAAIKEQKLVAICESLAHGSSRTAAARAASISHATFYAWLQDPAILARIEQAEGEMINAVADRLFEIATKGPANSAWLAGLSLAERRSPEWIRPTQKIEQTTRVEGEINIRHVLRSPESINAASALERAMQEDDARSLPEGDVIEGEIVPRLPE